MEMHEEDDMWEEIDPVRLACLKSKKKALADCYKKKHYEACYNGYKQLLGEYGDILEGNDRHVIFRNLAQTSFVMERYIDALQFVEYAKKSIEVLPEGYKCFVIALKAAAANGCWQKFTDYLLEAFHFDDATGCTNTDKYVRILAEVSDQMDDSSRQYIRSQLPRHARTLLKEENARKIVHPPVSIKASQAKSSKHTKRDNITEPSNCSSGTPPNPQTTVSVPVSAPVSPPSSEEYKRICQEAANAHQMENYALELYKQALKFWSGIPPNSDPRSHFDLVLIKVLICDQQLETACYGNIAQAVGTLKSLVTIHARSLPALYVFLAKAFFLLNRFTLAQEWIQKGNDFLKKGIRFTKHTYPETNTTIPFTTVPAVTDHLKQLESDCSPFHPPDCVCRYKSCREVNVKHIAPSNDIYFSDPDFEGCTIIYCSEKCDLCFHLLCWKAWKSVNKEISLMDLKKPDVNIIGTSCPTPDCSGVISRLKFIASDGQTRWIPRDKHEPHKKGILASPKADKMPPPQQPPSRKRSRVTSHSRSDCTGAGRGASAERPPATPESTCSTSASRDASAERSSATPESTGSTGVGRCVSSERPPTTLESTCSTSASRDASAERPPATSESTRATVTSSDVPLSAIEQRQEPPVFTKEKRIQTDAPVLLDKFAQTAPFTDENKQNLIVAQRQLIVMENKYEKLREKYMILKNREDQVDEKVIATRNEERIQAVKIWKEACNIIFKNWFDRWKEIMLLLNTLRKRQKNIDYLNRLSIQWKALHPHASRQFEEFKRESLISPTAHVTLQLPELPEPPQGMFSVSGFFEILFQESQGLDSYYAAAHCEFSPDIVNGRPSDPEIHHEDLKARGFSSDYNLVDLNTLNLPSVESSCYARDRYPNLVPADLPDSNSNLADQILEWVNRSAIPEQNNEKSSPPQRVVAEPQVIPHSEYLIPDENHKDWLKEDINCLKPGDLYEILSDPSFLNDDNLDSKREDGYHERIDLGRLEPRPPSFQEPDSVKNNGISPPCADGDNGNGSFEADDEDGSEGGGNGSGDSAITDNDYADSANVDVENGNEGSDEDANSGTAKSWESYTGSTKDDSEEDELNAYCAPVSNRFQQLAPQKGKARTETSNEASEDTASANKPTPQPIFGNIGTFASGINLTEQPVREKPAPAFSNGGKGSVNKQQHSVPLPPPIPLALAPVLDRAPAKAAKIHLNAASASNWALAAQSDSELSGNWIRMAAPAYDRLLLYLFTQPQFAAKSEEEIRRCLQALRVEDRMIFSTKTLPEILTAIQAKLAQQSCRRLVLHKFSSVAWAISSPARKVSNLATKKELEECSICIETLTGIIDIMHLKCDHSFHSHCLRKWLKNNRTCPICRDHVVTKEEFPALP